MNRIEITQCTIKNLLEIKAISEMTFAETFSDTNSEEDMKAYLETNFNVDQLTLEINNPDSMFFVVKVDGDLAGYLKLNIGSAQTEDILPSAMEVHRIYILTKYKGLGIGKSLIERGISLAKELKLTGVWLGVWEHNAPAIAFYKNRGFEKFDEHTFVLGEDVQIDHLMRKIL